MNESLRSTPKSPVDSSIDNNFTEPNTDNDDTDLTPEEFYKLQTAMDREVTADEIIKLAEKTNTPIEEVEVLDVSEGVSNRTTTDAKAQAREQAQLRAIRKIAKLEAQEKQAQELQESKPVGLIGKIKAWFHKEQLDERTLSEIMAENKSSEAHVNDTEGLTADIETIAEDEELNRSTVLEEFTVTNDINHNTTLSADEVKSIEAIKREYKERRRERNMAVMPAWVRGLFAVKPADNQVVKEMDTKSTLQDR